MLAFAPRGVFLYYNLLCTMLRCEERLDLTLTECIHQNIINEIQPDSPTKEI